MKSLKSLKAAKPKCEVFTADEFRRILEPSDDVTRPAIVFGGFARLRIAELGRIQWKDVKIEQKVVDVGAHVAKTQSRRDVAEWLGLAGLCALVTMEAPNLLGNLLIAEGGVR